MASGDRVTDKDDFESAEGEVRASAEVFVLRLDGFEGPIDLLLTLARQQKVDLAKLSILQLAEQYLEFVDRARAHRLDLAADYLVMAAWLAYLKSRLLLPAEEVDDEEPSGAAMAAALQFQLLLLEGMRDAAVRLFARPRLGIDTFARGAPEGIRVTTRAVYDASLFDLLSAYGAIQRRDDEPAPLTIVASRLHSIDQALQRLRAMLGGLREWTALMGFLPSDLEADDLVRRSASAALLGASLELAKSGGIQLRQDRQFGPIYVRRNAQSALTTPVVNPESTE